MITQQLSDAWRRRGSALVTIAVIGAIAGLVLLLNAGRRWALSSSAPPLPDRLATWVESIERADSPAAQALAAGKMLRDARPEARAAACAWIGREQRRDLTWLLLPRMSDADWRVRAAAFDAAVRVAGDMPGVPRAPAPLRDAPVEQREHVLLAWISGWQAAAGDGAVTPPAHAELCELYAPAGDHWLTGPQLAQSCLTCHAPPDRYAEADFARCMDCHGSAHDEFFRSSHARSTTHLNLLRVDPQRKVVERFDPGPRQGLVCTTCHAVADAGATAVAPPPGTEDLPVPHRFAAATSCATCHHETQREWDIWRTNPRPMPSRWLPGEVTWDDSPEQRTCVSCHMEERGGDAVGQRVHALASRRDASFMRSGLIVHLEPATADRGTQLVLTNLAGHRYPSGTIRRALRIEVSYHTDGQHTPWSVLTRLTDSPLPPAPPFQAALAPGEQRRLELPGVEGASRVTCQIIYERDQYRSGAYELPLHRLSGPVRDAGTGIDSDDSS